MVCSVQKVKVAVKSAKIGASSHVTNSILKNAAKWSVYASTVTYPYLEFRDHKIVINPRSLYPVDSRYEDSI